MVKRTVGKLMRDLLSYVAIALLVLAIISVLAVLTAKKGQQPDPFMLNWIGLGGVMAIVYGTAIQQHRRFWKDTRFWSGLAFALLFEIGLGILVLWSAPRITLWWGLLIYPANTVALDEFLNRWLVRAARHQE